MLSLSLFLAIQLAAPPPTPATQTGAAAVDVPLCLYVDRNWPQGVNFGASRGISFGDFNGDGWIDVFSCESANLWHNQAGQTWRLAADLDSVLPFAEIRYGASLADYDGDGLPDIAVEPRASGGDGCFHLLRNLGNGIDFDDVALDPNVFPGPFCDLLSETACWGDVDGDGDLDLFLPAYSFPSCPGNLFFESLAPSGPGLPIRFEERAAAAGLQATPHNMRPEGAQFCDVDFDGDIDLYCGGALYQNRAPRGTIAPPTFEALDTTSNGIGFQGSTDEGAVFFDYDMDGDFDLLVAYVSRRIRIWESRGDGSFIETKGRIEQPNVGTELGISAVDWDNDGDIDLTTRHVFRKNLLMESGVPTFALASNKIQPGHLLNSTPAWGDWDLDGDLDCALANFENDAWFYENSTYSRSTSPLERMDLRVRVVRDSPDVPRGLEQEFGARVIVRVEGEDPAIHRTGFVASSHGYLNQNEYTLHFALPPGPDPAAPSKDVRFALEVAFPGTSGEGQLHLTQNVNRALGNLRLDRLEDREITVFRSGRVVIDGVSHPPSPNWTLTRNPTSEGLIQIESGSPLPPPTPSPTANAYVGVELDTREAQDAVLVEEIILDGALDLALPCGQDPINLAAWDVTDPENLFPVYVAEASTSVRNHRSRIPCRFKLPSGRVYRIVARVRSHRKTPISGATWEAPLLVRGGLSFVDPNPCSGEAVAGAPVDSSGVYLSVGYRVRGAVTGSIGVGGRSR